MAEPFTCPHCGAHDYIITLTGCNITNATVQEAFEWDEQEKDYGSSGSIIVDSEGVENEGGEATCSNCEKDVSEAVAQYEDKIVGGAAQA
ncbi:MAG: hypothetical protein M3P27_07610 [Acidobacteriota bacterium]|nr:hypothetical protein [Acidobacteriota bacterium]